MQDHFYFHTHKHNRSKCESRKTSWIGYASSLKNFYSQTNQMKNVIIAGHLQFSADSAILSTAVPNWTAGLRKYVY